MEIEELKQYLLTNVLMFGRADLNIPSDQETKLNALMLLYDNSAVLELIKYEPYGLVNLAVVLGADQLIPLTRIYPELEPVSKSTACHAMCLIIAISGDPISEETWGTLRNLMIPRLLEEMREISPVAEKGVNVEKAIGIMCRKQPENNHDFIKSNPSAICRI